MIRPRPYRSAIKAALFGGLCSLAFCAPAFASFLDSDFYCRNFGCAVVHDGANYDIYDNYIFGSGCCVAIGQPMVPYTRNFGTFNLTGSLDTPVTPNADQGMMIGVTQNGSTITNSIIDDGDGFLDADDMFSNAFSMGPNTDIRLSGTGREYSHSFFITSRNTRFSLRANASIANATQDFASGISLDDIALSASIDSNGNDDGFRFGPRANASQITLVGGVNDLGDLQGAPIRLIEFDRFTGIRQRNGDLDNQSIRLDFLYTMPEYDLSMGVGSMNIDVEFDFYREP